MAKRRSVNAPEGDRIKTSVSLARPTHARLSALASLRGCSLNAILAEAADEVARQVVIVDKRAKAADQRDLPIQVKESADAPANLDGPEDRVDQQAA